MPLTLPRSWGQLRVVGHSVLQPRATTWAGPREAAHNGINTTADGV